MAVPLPTLIHPTSQQSRQRPGPAKNGQNANPQPPPPRPSGPGLLLTITDLKRLPFVEQTTEFKCVEGWSQIVTYGGVRFRDFFETYPPLRNADGSLPRYAALATPDGAYYSGFELADLLHPQTLLCYQMSRQDLTPAHGAPLRLAMPLKYGYKQIKQIASITYTDTKPADYWGSHSYDWDGGL
jgi:DMSO/TMAO reductase YedYZ molybdopterin-dependent catalytic subunit